MDFRQHLFDCLSRIAECVRCYAHALAPLALGSVGTERERIDEYSDVDFFLIITDGAKSRLVDDLWWLREAHTLQWSFQNTVDGHRALMSDGVLCEFAVFKRNKLGHIPYSPGQFVWRRYDVHVNLARSRRALPQFHRCDWLVGEALSSLLVGLGRYARGENLAAMRMIQVHTRLRRLDLKEQAVGIAAAGRDPFNVDRRIEQRVDSSSLNLGALAPGYERTPGAAACVLNELAAYARILDEIATPIRALFDRCKMSRVEQ